MKSTRFTFFRTKSHGQIKRSISEERQTQLMETRILRRGLFILRSEGIVRFLFSALGYFSYKVELHRRVGELPRPLANKIFIFIKKMICIKIYILNKFYPYKYTDADPYKIINVNPSEIKYAWEVGSRFRGRVEDGNWAEERVPFWNRKIPYAIRQHYEEGVPWEETVLANDNDIEKCRKQANSIEELYNSIDEVGCLSQKDLLTDSPDIAWEGVHDTMHPIVNEISVDIGPSGELIWHRSGRHRLAIAKILGIEEISVQVIRRHRNWQYFRYLSQARDEKSNKLINHPDIETNQ